MEKSMKKKVINFQANSTTPFLTDGAELSTNEGKEKEKKTDPAGKNFFHKNFWLIATFCSISLSIIVSFFCLKSRNVILILKPLWNISGEAIWKLYSEHRQTNTHEGSTSVVRTTIQWKTIVLLISEIMYFGFIIFLIWDDKDEWLTLTYKVVPIAIINLMANKLTIPFIGRQIKFIFKYCCKILEDRRSHVISADLEASKTEKVVSRPITSTTPFIPDEYLNPTSATNEGNPKPDPPGTSFSGKLFLTLTISCFTSLSIIVAFFCELITICLFLILMRVIKTVGMTICKLYGDEIIKKWKQCWEKAGNCCYKKLERRQNNTPEGEVETSLEIAGKNSDSHADCQHQWKTTIPWERIESISAIIYAIYVGILLLDINYEWLTLKNKVGVTEIINPLAENLALPFIGRQIVKSCLGKILKHNNAIFAASKKPKVVLRPSLSATPFTPTTTPTDVAVPCCSKDLETYDSKNLITKGDTRYPAMELQEILIHNPLGVNE